MIKTKNQEQLQALINRKDDLTKFLASEKTRFKHPSHSLSVSSIKRFVSILENEIKTIDEQIQSLIKKGLCCMNHLNGLHNLL
jgi:hypothetical protein